jgi:hypothetical protein
MYNFKQFFNKNYDFTVLLEAVRGGFPKEAVLYDDEDLDFLYQIDQKYWVNALRLRYLKTWSLLKTRQEIRNRIIREMLNAIKQSEFSKPVSVKAFKKEGENRQEIGTRRVNKLYINKNNIDKFKEFLLSLGDSYDSYGNKVEVTDPEEIRKRKFWLNELFEEYDIENVSTRGIKDNQRAIKDLIYEVIKRIVIYVKGGDQELYSIEGKNIKLYINRLIQKLETTKGEEHHLKTRLENLSKVYGRDIKFETKGKYGFDLSSPRVIKSIDDNGKKTILYRTGAGENGYVFPKRSSIKKSLNRLYALNYHRHLGSLPTDDPTHPHDITYKVIKSETDTDQFALDVLKTNISNNIKRFLIKNRKIDWYSDNIQELLEGSPDPEKEKNEMESGLWFVKSFLGNNANIEDVLKIPMSRLKGVFGISESKLSDIFKSIGIESGNKYKILNWMTSYQKIANNHQLRDMFASYFGELRASMIIESQTAYGPKILSVNITGDPEKDAEIRKKELSLLDEKDKEELKKILGEDWEKFVKTGRLPYRIEKKEIKVGKSKPPIILPHVKVGEGKNSVSFPLLNSGLYVRQSNLLDPREEKSISNLKNRIKNILLKTDVVLDDLDLGIIEDLETLRSSIEFKPKFNKVKKLIDILIEKLKSRESLEKEIITTSRSSSVIGSEGEEIPIVKYHRMKRYKQGVRGTVLAGQRPESAGTVPRAAASREAKIGYAKIFPIGSVVIGLPPGTQHNARGGSRIDAILIDDKIWSYFRIKNPDGSLGGIDPKILPAKWLPMQFTKYRISNNLEGFQTQNESINTSKFMIIKEESEDADSEVRDGALPKKKTEKYNRVGNIWFEINPVRGKHEDSSNVEGWNDIIEGMKQALFGVSHGGHDAEPIVKHYYLKPENFQNLHDEIVYYFYSNSTNRSLHSRSGRRQAASAFVGRILQRRSEIIKGSVSRKLRTGENIRGDVETKPNDIGSDLNLEDIKPLSKESDKELTLGIFVDFENTLKTKLGKNLISIGGKGYSFRGGPQLPKNEEEESGPNFEEYLSVRSKLLVYIDSNLDKINSTNYKKIIEMLGVEKNNLISRWSDIFNTLKNSFKGELPKEVDYYFKGSNKETIDNLNSIYDKKIELVKSRAKVSTDIKPVVSSVPGDNIENIKIRMGIANLQEIIRDINKILEEFSLKINHEKKERGKTRLVTRSTLPIEEYDNDLPPIANWFRMLINLLQSLNTTTMTHDTNLSLFQFIGTHKGGLSVDKTNLKYQVHKFLNSIDKNISDFMDVKFDIDELKTNNKLKYSLINQIKDQMKRIVPALPSLIQRKKQNLINLLKN